MTSAAPTTCTGCGRQLTVLSVGDLCRPCHRRREPSPPADVPTTNSTVDFQDSGVCVAPPTSVVSADVCGASDASFTARSSGSTSTSGSSSARKRRDWRQYREFVKAWEDEGRPDVSIRLEHDPAVRDRLGHLATLVEFFGRAFGIRDAYGEDRPFPAGHAFIAEETSIPVGAVHRWVQRLCACGAIHRCHAGAKLRTGRVVFTYLPGPHAGCGHCGGLGAEAPVIELEAGAVSVEPAAGRERPVQPVAEHDDREAVPPAQVEWGPLDDLYGQPRVERPDRSSRRVPASPSRAPAHTPQPIRDDGWDPHYLESIHDPEAER